MLARGWRRLSSAAAARPVLGLETSCDETAAAVVAPDGRVLSSVVASQWAIHAEWGGIVPHLAARAHESNAAPVMERALAESGLQAADLAAVAVTSGPGLAPCLNVGVGAARAVAEAGGVPLLGVHHIEAHALVPRIDDPSIVFPFLALIASGGHSTLALVRSPSQFETLGSAMDDSVGEAFDKVARMLGLLDGGPHAHGGALLEQRAALGDPAAFPFTIPLLQPKHRRHCDISFAGLKTAVSLRCQELDLADEGTVNDVAASFQRVAVEHLRRRTDLALRMAEEAPTCLVVAGGVAANEAVRAALGGLAADFGIEARWPELALCSDNGVMIAWAALERLREGTARPVDEVRARWPLPGPRLPLRTRRAPLELESG